MRGSTFRWSFVCALVFGACFAAAATAARMPVGTTPATIVLPDGWSMIAKAAGSRFDASAGSGYGRLQVTSGGLFPALVPFSQFVQTEVTSAQRAYKKQDRHAVVTGRKVTLPSGPAVEITAIVHHGTPLAIYLFSFLHKGVTYHFTFFTNASSAPSMRGSFIAAAQSIRFK